VEVNSLIQDIGRSELKYVSSIAMTANASPGLIADFNAGSITHGIVLLSLAAMTAILICMGRKAREKNAQDARRLDRILAIALYAIWIVLTCRNLLPGHFRWDRSLPLHICDLTGLAAPIALWTRWRPARAILYFWGLGLSTQAFITPMLSAGPMHLDFWVYWISHFAIVMTAIYDLAVRAYQPNWHDWRTTVLISAAYVLLVLPINQRLGVNYGYLGRTEVAQRTLIRVLGPWPERVPRLVALVWIGMAAMVPLGTSIEVKTASVPATISSVQ
jgi:hypothetical integral membrane protein (TIGR02206 family)